MYAKPLRDHISLERSTYQPRGWVAAPPLRYPLDAGHAPL